MKDIEKQLILILKEEKVSSIMILSGEYLSGEYRNKNLNKVQWTINKALDMGFQKVLINIGSLSETEIASFYKNTVDPNKLGLSIFQETYNEKVYHKYFGRTDSLIPKSNFNTRLDTPERWLKSGFTTINIGILLGLAPVDEDIDSLVSHAISLRGKYKCNILISVPRIIGYDNKFPISDKEFIECLKKIKKQIPWCHIIISTRESLEIISQVLPVVSVISPGSSDVLAYSKDGISNNPKTSQFVVGKKRKRPRDVLNLIESNEKICLKYFKEGEVGQNLSVNADN
ncbi:hypothetical protein [Candidatus Enterococcus ikei]|uniref:Radical SAM core domain-containing protein n=1 Tax=Candidatus Enterococcus ikei TaxID=2815326 RepID=A0ABS3GUT5_9ENTE|nr:hypothetical protein [Enterococcus sp. DIV0869a]MBO0439016.1 hypothetical protein [Enterococcus sp. DIV0869a]